MVWSWIDGTQHASLTGSEAFGSTCFEGGKQIVVSSLASLSRGRGCSYVKLRLRVAHRSPANVARFLRALNETSHVVLERWETMCLPDRQRSFIHQLLGRAKQIVVSSLVSLSRGSGCSYVKLSLPVAHRSPANVPRLLRGLTGHNVPP